MAKNIGGQMSNTRKLSDTGIKNLKPVAKKTKHYDGNYLYLMQMPSGSKLWKIIYKSYIYVDKTKKPIEKSISLGKYPTVTLKDARIETEKAITAFKNGIDYCEVIKSEKQQLLNSNHKKTFSYLASEWLKTSNSTSKTIQGLQGRLNNHIFPHIGNKQIDAINRTEIIDLLRRIDLTEQSETLKRCKNIISRVFQYAINIGVCENNPAQNINGIFKNTKVKHMPTITDTKQIGILLRAIDNYAGSFVIKQALKIAPYVMLRPNEIRFAQWDFIDFDEKTWKIPAEYMKKRQIHVIPLANQVINELEALHQLTGNTKYLFPHVSKKDRTMSENSLNNALHTLGYKNIIVAHGFRAMASTLLHEMGYPTEHIEKQLAHNDKNNVRASYNHADYLEQRTKMMQDWADYLDILRGDNE